MVVCVEEGKNGGRRTENKSKSKRGVREGGKREGEGRTGRTGVKVKVKVDAVSVSRE